MLKANSIHITTLETIRGAFEALSHSKSMISYDLLFPQCHLHVSGGLKLTKGADNNILTCLTSLGICPYADANPITHPWSLEVSWSFVFPTWASHCKCKISKDTRGPPQVDKHKVAKELQLQSFHMFVQLNQLSNLNALRHFFQGRLRWGQFSTVTFSEGCLAGKACSQRRRTSEIFPTLHFLSLSILMHSHAGRDSCQARHKQKMSSDLCWKSWDSNL